MAPQNISRRDILSAGLVVGSAGALGDLPAGAKTIAGEVPWSPGVANAPEPITPGGYQFFSPDEAAFVDAAISRLIPQDELGAGAREAGVATFIDRQLAGPFGTAESWYMQGPWGEGSKSQGYQTRLTPAQLYRAAIKGIDEHCHATQSGKSFAELQPSQQDQVLTSLEKGEIKLKGAEAVTFFETFLQNTIEGFFSDPIYGGNREMAGWKLIGFPGARYDYRPYVARHGEKLNLPPVGIKGRAEWTPRS